MPDLVDFDTLGERERYKLLASLIVPRPIAWVTTVSAEGVPNAAPFSMFAMVGEEPPVLMISVNRVGSDGQKDTAANIDATSEFVVHIPDEPLTDVMDATSTSHPPHIDELAHLGLATRPADLVRPPIIDAAAVAFECTLWHRFEIPSRQVYFGRVRRLHVRDGLIDRDRWRVRLQDYHPVGRFGASFYTGTRDRFAAAGGATATDIDSL